MEKVWGRYGGGPGTYYESIVISAGKPNINQPEKNVDMESRNRQIGALVEGVHTMSK